MEKYYVSGCKDNGSETATCDDNEAQFWTLYVRDDAGFSQGIIDCVFREDAETAMAVYVERDALQEQVWALAAEGAGMKAGASYFSYGSEHDFEWHKTAEEAVEAAEAAIDDYRGDACDGWSEEVDSVCWGIIMQSSTKVGERPRNEDDRCDPAISTICDYALLPNIETPATDTALREIRAQARAEGIHFAANRLLAAWESGFVDDTPADVHDISGAILSAVEFLPSAAEGEFKRDYADEVRDRIRAGEQP